MRATPLLLVGLLVSGCITSAPDPGSPRTMFACPEYPDGSAVDCGQNLLRTEGIATTFPGPETGWLCTLRHRSDAGIGVYDFYVHQDGRIAYAWDLTPARAGGFMVLQASVYGSGSTQALVAAYQPKGFAIFSEKRQTDTADVHLLLWHVLVDEKVDGVWTARDARPLVSDYQGHAWYVLQLDGTEPEYVSPMVDGDAPRDHELGDRLIQEQGRELFVEAWVSGAKFAKANIGWPSSGNTRCQL